MQSIEAGERWKEQYKATSRAVAVRCPRPWDFDVSSIFAHIDAFLQARECALLHGTLCCLLGQQEQLGQLCIHSYPCMLLLLLGIYHCGFL